MRKNVLIITDMGLSHAGPAAITRELMSRLTSLGYYQVEFYVESLDSSEPDLEFRKSLLVRQYQHHKIDAIVALGPETIKFLSRIQDWFLPDVPIVICGSTEEQAGRPKLGSRFTGSWLTLDFTKTVDVARQLVPDTRTVVIVGGASDYDRRLQAIAKDSLSSYPVPLELVYLTDLDMSHLLERLHRLPSNTIVLYLTFFRDVADGEFVNATAALPLVSQAANAPVFGVSDTYLGHGAVGGYVLSFGEQGKMTSQVLADIFAGKKAQDIPIATGLNSYMFDWQQLRRWKLDPTRLPSGSVVLFRPPTVWERDKWILLTALFVVVGMAACTAYVVYKNRQLMRSRAQQIWLSGKLIAAQEDERKRIASDLHDDLSQRLALLSLGLESMTEVIPQSCTEAVRQLNELLRSADELGADIHTLSHRLHSSTLERLGLVPGIGALCKEFAKQSGIEVNFSNMHVPDHVPPDIALCLFRVVQEALQNVKKHSKASRANVILDFDDGCLHLSIADNGIGFVKDPNGRQGVGIYSMQERTRLIGGRFQVESAPQQGTRVDLWTKVEPVAQEQKRYATAVS